MKNRIAVIGGDARQLTAASRLRAAGYDTVIYGFGGYPAAEDHGTVDTLCCSSYTGVPTELSAQIAAAGRRADTLGEALCGCGCVLLPLPVSTDGVSISMPYANGVSIRFDMLCAEMKKQGVGLLFGGRISEGLSELCGTCGIEWLDYYEREEFTVANAIPTAEGGIEIAMHELPITLHGSKSLVIGFGRIGKVLARHLKSLGSEVTVSARKSADHAWIRAEGFREAHTGKLDVLLGSESFNVIFNTVPFGVLGVEELSLLPRDTLIIDLASKPGGIRAEAFGKFPHRVIWALSLPGKVAPVTSGGIIAQTVLGVLDEKSRG